MMLTARRLARKKRVKAKVLGTAKTPRLSVFRSNKYVYAQLIDDQKNVTLVHAKGEVAKLVGEQIAKDAKKKKISSAVFDRSGYKYHGKVKALADAAREGGLKF